MINEFDLYGGFRVSTFTEIWDNVEKFTTDIIESGMPIEITQESLTTLYYLLYARYGNSHIVNEIDENQWKYSLYGVIFMYGPTWEKRLDIQRKVRSLSDEDIITGGVAIHNHASNPSTIPTTATLDELTYIDNQSTSRFKKSKLEAYALLSSLVETDVTEEFINKFKKLFKTFVMPNKPLVFEEIEIN